MSNKNTSKTHRVPLFKRPIVLVSLAVILVAVIALTIWAFAHFSQANSTDNSTPVSSGTSSSSSQPQDSTSQPNEEEAPTEPERPAQYEGEDPNTLSELTGSITLNTHDASTLTVAVSIDQYLAEPGTCQLELSQNGSILHTAELIALADITTSGCGPFIVPITGLSSGTYQLKIIISGDYKTGLVTGEIKI